ncbi:MAG: hypothetical protein RIT81_03510 [Deltaproteobacteria bacterium]
MRRSLCAGLLLLGACEIEYSENDEPGFSPPICGVNASCVSCTDPNGCDPDRLVLSGADTADGILLTRFALPTAVGGLQTIDVETFTTTIPLYTHLSSGGAAEVVDVGTDYVVVRGVRAGSVDLIVRNGFDEGQIELEVEPIERVEVGLVEAASGLLGTGRELASRAVAPGGATPVHVRLFGTSGRRVVDEGVTSATSTATWPEDARLRWDTVLASVPEASEGPQLLVVLTSDGRLWPRMVEAAGVDEIRLEPPQERRTLRGERLVTLCFSARWRGRVVSAPHWGFEVAGETLFRFAGEVLHFGHMTCAPTRTASLGPRKMRVTAGGYEQVVDFVY